MIQQQNCHFTDGTLSFCVHKDETLVRFVPQHYNRKIIIIKVENQLVILSADLGCPLNTLTQSHG